MKNNLEFDFLVDKENNTLTIVREFNAERQLVWDCYTKQELLDQWFAIGLSPTAVGGRIKRGMKHLIWRTLIIDDSV